MKKNIVFTSAILLAFPLLSLAAPITNNPCGVSINSNLGACVSQVYVWSLGIAAILAVMMIVVGGYITLSARGNASQAEKGRSYITSSLIGLALLFGAYLLLNTINPQLTNFNFDASNYIQTPSSPTAPRNP